MSNYIGKPSQQLIREIFNGPPIAGVGATTDKGLTREMFHVLPYDTNNLVDCSYVNKDGDISIEMPSGMKELDSHMAMQYAIYNVDVVYNIASKANNANVVDATIIDKLRDDLIAIVFLEIVYNVGINEVVKSTKEQEASISDIGMTNEYFESVANLGMLNRALTFMMARMHTKYQTNHVLGGSVPQASVRSCISAFYDIQFPLKDRDRNVGEFVLSALYWAVHPINEKYLVPQVIKNSMIDKFSVCKDGPSPIVFGKEEYFVLREDTPPAGTHFFSVAAASVKNLVPFGVMKYLPQPDRLVDAVVGVAMIQTHGAALHPAARFWGIKRVSISQRKVESLVADLGYAMRQLFSSSTLARSPIFDRVDMVTPIWKLFIDGVKAKMDTVVSRAVTDKVLNEVVKKVSIAEGGTPEADRAFEALLSDNILEYIDLNTMTIISSDSGKGKSSE